MSKIIVFIFGLCVGSFLNVVIFRLREGKKFIKGRSICPNCKHEILWYDNIPLISYFFLKGQCRHCRKKISMQYPLVELATGVLFASAFIRWQKISTFLPAQAVQFSILARRIGGSNFQFLPALLAGPISNYGLLLSYFIFTSILIIIFVYDFRWYLILDKISIPAIIIALVLNLILGYSILNLFGASLAAGGFFLAQFLVSKGKWIGGGDIRFGFLIGIMLGWPNVILALFSAYMMGSVVGLGLIIFGKKKMGSRVPFGTFLALATYIVMLWGESILRWYMGILK